MTDEPQDMRPGTPAELLALDLGALVGQPVDAARAQVEAAGGRLRAVAPGGAMTMDYRGDRVTVVVVADEVLEVIGIG
jgi:hypothetical protein